MDIKRIGGGIESSQSLISLILPGDKDYHSRTVQSSRVGNQQPAQTVSRVQNPGWVFTSPILTINERRQANENALDFLRYLGDMETSGSIRIFAGSSNQDSYAGGHSGVIDILV